MTASYTAGTVSVTAGSDIVTGVGTGWQTANIAPGFFGLDGSNGNPIPVAEVVSDTSMRLVTPWRGTSVSGQAYWLSYDTRDGQQTVNNAQRLAEFLARLNSSILSGIAALTPTENSFLYFGLNGVAALSNSTALGRTLMAATNSAAAYNALGEIPSANLPSRLQAVPTLVSAANALDNISETGWVRVANASVAAVNGPAGGGSGVCFTIVFDGNAGMQIYTQVTSASGASRQWIRNKSAGVWTTWTPTVVGDVSDASNLTSGAFRGWGAGFGSPSATLDANSLTGNGVFFAAAGSTNTASNGWGYIMQFQRETERKTQIFADSFSSNPRLYIRIQLAEGWSTWRQIPFAQTSTTDTTATAAMLVGAFGLGGTGVLLVATDDLNNLPIATCSYRWGSTAVPSNSPSGGSYLMEQISFGSGGCTQTAYNLSGTNIIWHRKQAGGAWTSWKRIDGSGDGDVVGPSSSTTNGITGFSNTTGKAIKQLTVLEGLGSLGPVFGHVSPKPSSAGVGISDGNFNNVNIGGVYTISGSWIGGPYNSGSTALIYTGILEVEVIEGGGLIVQVYRHEDGSAFKRFAVPGTWSPWLRIEASVPFSVTAGDFTQFTDGAGNLGPATIASQVLLGRSSSGNGSVERLSAAQTRTILSVPTVAEMNALVTTARQVRLGGQGVATTVIDQWTIAPSGSLLTAVRVDGIYGAREVAYRAVQQTNLAGTWVNVSQV